MEQEICVIDLGYSPIPDRCKRKLDEVTVKKDGYIWRIQMNDSDPFLSNPHAHNVESGLKLCLSTGGLYYKRKKVQTMNKKHFLDLRNKIIGTRIQLPDLKGVENNG